MIVGEVVGLLKLDKKQWNAAIKTSKQQLKGFGGTAKSVAKVIKDNWIKITAVFVAVGLAVRKIMKTFGDFQQRMSDVSTLLNKETMPALEGMKQGIIDMMKEIPKSADELGAGLYQTLSAGIEAGAEALSVLRTSARLAVTGLGSTEEAVTLMTLALNNFRDSGLTAEEVANVLFKTVKGGITTVADLAKSFGLVAPLAEEAGITFIELQAVTAALTQVNKSASISQNAVKASLVSLAKPTREALELFKGLGVKTFPELIKNTGGYVEALKALRDETKGNTQAFAKAIGSGEALSAVNALLGSQYEVVTQNMKDMKSGTDDLSEGFDKQKKTFKSAMQILKNNIDVVAFAVGENLAPTLITLAEEIPKAFRPIDRIFEVLGGTILTLARIIQLVQQPLVGVFNQLEEGTSIFDKFNKKFNETIENINKKRREQGKEELPLLPVREEDLKNIEGNVKSTLDTIISLWTEVRKNSKATWELILKDGEDAGIKWEEILKERKLAAIAARKGMTDNNTEQNDIEEEDNAEGLKKWKEIQEGMTTELEIRFDRWIAIQDAKRKIKEMTETAMARESAEAAAEEKVILEESFENFIRMEEVKRTIAKLTKEAQIREQKEQVGAFNVGMLTTVKNWKEGNEAMQEAGANFIQGFQNSFANDLVNAFKSGTNVMKSIWKSLTSNLLRVFMNMITKMIIAKTLLALIPGGGILGKFLHEGGAVKKHQGGEIKRAHQGIRLASNEVPIIGQAGEGMISKRGMRNVSETELGMLNAGMVPQMAFAGGQGQLLPIHIDIGGQRLADILLEISRDGAKVIDSGGIRRR